MISRILAGVFTGMHHPTVKLTRQMKFRCQYGTHLIRIPMKAAVRTPPIHLAPIVTEYSVSDPPSPGSNYIIEVWIIEF